MTPLLVNQGKECISSSLKSQNHRQNVLCLFSGRCVLWRRSARGSLQYRRRGILTNQFCPPPKHTHSPNSFTDWKKKKKRIAKLCHDGYKIKQNKRCKSKFSLYRLNLLLFLTYYFSIAEGFKLLYRSQCSLYLCVFYITQSGARKRKSL